MQLYRVNFIAITVHQAATSYSVLQSAHLAQVQVSAADAIVHQAQRRLSQHRQRCIGTQRRLPAVLGCDLLGTMCLCLRYTAQGLCGHGRQVAVSNRS